MSRNPSSILYDGYGNPVAIWDGYNILASTPGFPVITRSVDDVAKILFSNEDGYLYISSPGIEGVDFATETTLSSLESKDFATETTLASLEAKDFATESTLASLEAKDFATESTLTDAYNKLDSLEAKDFATETTLASLESKDFATENTLSDAYNRLVELEAKDFATETTLASLESKDFATESTLLDAYNKLDSLESKDFATETTLSSIKNTDGIKKITDPLPTGDNDIGRVKLIDGYSTQVPTIDGYALEHDSPGLPVIGKDNDSLARFLRVDDDGYLHAVSALVDENGTRVDVIHDPGDDTSPAANRLQVQSSIKPGSSINVGAPLPSDPSLIFTSFLSNGGSHDLLVNGSVTPVVFSVSADAYQDIVLNELRFVFSTDDMTFNGASFGPNIALTNGILVELTVNSGQSAELINVQINEDFLRFVGSQGINVLLNNTGPKDIYSGNFALGGSMILAAGSGDIVKVTIRDNLTSVKFHYLTATLYGAYD